MFSTESTDARDFNAKVDGYTEIRCPKKKGVIAAESCLEKQGDGCRCDFGLGALVQIRSAAKEEAVRPEHLQGNVITSEIQRRIDKAASQLVLADRIAGTLGERELKLFERLTPEEKSLWLPPVRALCEQCGNGCWGQNRLCSHCITKANRKPVRLCACGNKIGTRSKSDACQYCRPTGGKRSPDAPPTETEREVYVFIESWIAQHGEPPLPYQISAGLKRWAKFGSAYIEWLRKKGLVEGRGRDLKIVKPLPVRGAA